MDADGGARPCWCSIWPRRHGRGRLGLVTALQFLPMLLFGTWGGLIADRVDKRRLLSPPRRCAGVLALTLGLLTAVGAVRLWQVSCWPPASAS